MGHIGPILTYMPGYEKLIVYWLATTIYDLTVVFCKRYMSYTTNRTYMSYTNDSQSFCNLMVTLCSKEGYLLDRLLVANEEKFIKEGGFKENLFKKRMEYRRNND